MIWTIRRFRPFLRPYRRRLALGTVLTLGNTLFALLQPWPLKVIIDGVLRDRPLDLPGLGFAAGWSQIELLNAAIVGYVVILLLGALFDLLGT